MRMYDIIIKKRSNQELTKNEIEYFVNSYVHDTIKDYQVSALLMSIYFNGMTDKEISHLTMCMAKSGDIIDLSSIPGIKVDKHSTGGVGDKTTLIVAPIVACLGVRVAKMSGRGLGHTGGTVDKMKSIPGLKMDIKREDFFDIVKKVGASIISQTGNIVPADKKLYALRDVTATVDSIPLIASSIMSKKIAAGSDRILLDVKTGSGAFMKTDDQAIKLAKTMVSIGENIGRETIALITDMDIPLGFSIGNSLEIVEVCDVLKGKGPKDLTQISIELAANMLHLANKKDLNICRKLAKEVIDNKKAFEKLKEIIKAQNGDISVLEDKTKFDQAKYKKYLLAKKSGYLYNMDTEKCGISAMTLGAGRQTKEDIIDYSAGIVFNKKTGDKIEKGEIIATLYSNKKETISKSEEILHSALSITDKKPKTTPIIHARVSKDGVERYI